MKARNLFLAALALLISAGFAKADGLPADPRMVVTDPLCIENCGTTLESTTFNFSSNANGGATVRRRVGLWRGLATRSARGVRLDRPGMGLVR